MNNETSINTDLKTNTMLANIIYADTTLANRTIEYLKEKGLLDERMCLRNLKDVDPAIISNSGYSIDQIKHIYQKSLQVYSRNIPIKIYMCGHELKVGGLNVKTVWDA